MSSPAVELGLAPPAFVIYDRSVSSRRHLNVRGNGPGVLANGEGETVKGKRGHLYEFGRLVGVVGRVTLTVDGRAIGLGDIFHIGPSDRVTTDADGDYQLFFIEGHQ